MDLVEKSLILTSWFWRSGHSISRIMIIPLPLLSSQGLRRFPFAEENMSVIASPFPLSLLQNPASFLPSFLPKSDILLSRGASSLASSYALSLSLCLWSVCHPPSTFNLPRHTTHRIHPSIGNAFCLFRRPS